jgi:predicted LPLAT superfamily acyltransferase
VNGDLERQLDTINLAPVIQHHLDRVDVGIVENHANRARRIAPGNQVNVAAVGIITTASSMQCAEKLDARAIALIVGQLVEVQKKSVKLVTQREDLFEVTSSEPIQPNGPSTDVTLSFSRKCRMAA